MAENVADLTLAHVRKIDQTVSMIWEVLQRHETRMGPVERGYPGTQARYRRTEKRSSSDGEPPSPTADGIIKLTAPIEEHDERLEALEDH